MNRKSIYEKTITFLAILSVALAIIDVSTGLDPALRIVDNCIWGIFVVDYVVRLVLAKDKKRFVKNNVCDLIAIIPFNSALRVLRIAKASRLARLARITKFGKLSRLFAFSARLLNKLKRFLDTNGFKYMLSITAILVILSGILIHYVENMSFSDGIWWAFVTVTTVGYGDISPKTNLGRMIAMILMVSGIGLIGALTSTITSFFMRARGSKDVSSETIEHIKERLDDVKSLSDEDIDVICGILKTLNK